MPRSLRMTDIGYYHLINRGVEKRNVFLDSSDYLVFLSLINEYKSIHHFEIHAYCLMKNHYHLLMEIKQTNLSLIMQKINYRYSIYFNKKYQRVGHLWQGRFRSWFVTDEIYLNTLIRYIEQNPIRAGLTDDVGEYRWSSMKTGNEQLSNNEFQTLEHFHNSN